MLGVSRSGYYAARGRAPSARAQADERLAREIRQIHRESRQTYGSPRIYRELSARQIPAGRHRVARLMRQQGLSARRRRRFRRTTELDPRLPTAPNHLQRNFSAQQPDQTWMTDITYLKTDQGWLYLAVVLDLFSRRVIGWSMANHLRKELALRALDMALLRRRPPRGQLLHHSDRGCQYASRAYRRALRLRQIRCSMSRKGNCWDNAVVESFFGTLKQELVHRCRWRTHAEARTAVYEYIEAFYNRRRRHSSLGYLSPVEFEDRYHAACYEVA